MNLVRSATSALGIRPLYRGPSSLLLGAGALAWTPWALARIVDVDRLGWWAVAPQVLSLYALGLTAVVFVAALVLHRWTPAALAAAGVAVLVGLTGGRAIANPQPAVPSAMPLTVMVLNVNQGRADPQRVVGLVRRYGVDGLALKELTVPGLRALQAAGIEDELPHGQLRPAPASGGAAALSREQSTWLVRRWIGLDLKVGQARVRFEAVNAVPPRPKTARTYANSPTLNEVPSASAAGVPTVVAGDFNATLDNRRVRQLLARGYRDAADQAGAGLAPTWSGLHGLLGLTIDHVLVGPQLAVDEVNVEPVPGTDHRAVIVRLRVPFAAAPPAGDVAEPASRPNTR